MEKFSVQQFTFRPWSNQEGLFPVLQRISAMGYTGLEMCCFGGFEALQMPARELKSRLADLGMELVGNHFTRDLFRGSHGEAFSYIAEAGGKYAIYNIWGSYDTLRDVQEKAEYLNSLADIAQREGVTLLYHNHAQEFTVMEGRPVIDRLEDALDPRIFFEHDVYFSRKQGCDVYGYLRAHAGRIRAVHLKQIDAAGENVDLPDGILDIARVIRCASQATDYIVEQASFRDSISASLQRNGEFLRNLPAE